MKNNRRDQANLILVSLLSTIVSGCAVFFPNSRPSDPLAALQYDVRTVLADSIFVAARPSIKVVSLDTKEVIFERDSKLLMRPASNMKLVTSSSALGVLGKDYQFRTQVLADTTLSDGTLHGNLYLKGLGNPDLATADLDSLASLVKLRGVKSVEWSVIADVSFFDDIYWGYGWNWDDEPYSYAPFLTPLSVNDNCVSVSVSPGDSIGGPARVSIEPPTSYVTVLNRARTVRDTVSHPLLVTRLFKEHLNTILVEGNSRECQYYPARYQRLEARIVCCDPVHRVASAQRNHGRERACHRHNTEIRARGGIVSSWPRFNNRKHEQSER
jgi:D-alanyl-D-alanine carboxypeptidase